MHGVAGVLGERLGHEGGEGAPAAGELTRRVLEPGRLVGGREGVGVAEIDLALAGAVLGVAALQLDEPRRPSRISPNTGSSSLSTCSE